MYSSNNLKFDKILVHPNMLYQIIPNNVKRLLLKFTKTLSRTLSYAVSQQDKINIEFEYYWSCKKCVQIIFPQ